MLVRIICSGFICLIIQIVLGVIIYFGILIIFKDEFIYLIVDRIKQKFLNVLKKG